MGLEAWFQLIETVAVVVAVGFAIVQVQQYKRDKNREAALVLLNSFQTPEFAKALMLVYSMPEGLSKQEIEDRLGEDMHLVYALTTTWESLGVLIHRGEMSIELVDDFFSGPITISWHKLNSYFIEDREALGRETVGEWFQWLAERFEDRESNIAPVPAHVAHKDWKPPRKDS